MNKFLDELSKMLRGNIPDNYVKSNLDYYKQYIYEEKAKGRKESDIIDELGDPRLIAKNIISTSPIQNKDYSKTYYEEYNNAAGNDNHSEYEEKYNQKKYKRTKKTMNFLGRMLSNRVGRIIIAAGGFIITAIIIWLIISLIGMIFAFLFPIIGVVILIKIIINIIKGR